MTFSIIFVLYCVRNEQTTIFNYNLNPIYQLNKNVMNKAELISAIAEKANLSKVDSKKALDAFLGIVENTLKKGDKVVLVGFGTFS